MNKIRKILMPKLIQLTHSRQVKNEGYTFITRIKNPNKSPVRRFKTENISNTTLPMQNEGPKKPFSRGGPCRIGMARYCQIAKQYKEPVSAYYYPIYPKIDKIPLSTYVTNWRWYVSGISESRTLDRRVRGVGMDGYLLETNKPRLEEIQENPMVANLPSRMTRNDVYRD